MARKSRSLALGLLGLAGLFGCSDAAYAPGGPDESGPAIEYGLLYEVGRNEGGLTFGGIVPGVFGADGSLWVGEFFGGRVLLLDASGAPVGRLGGPGEGPGEFGELARVGLTPDGETVWAADGRRGRVTLFDRGSDSVRTVRRLDQYYAPPLTMQGPFAPLPDGTFAVLPPQTVGLPHQFPDTLVDQPIIRVDTEGVVLDTLVAPPPLAIGVLRLQNHPTIGATTRVLRERPRFWVAPNGLHLGVIDRLHGVEPGVLGTVHRARWVDGSWVRDTLMVPGEPDEGTRAEVSRRVDALLLSEEADRAAIVDEIETKPLGIPPYLSTISNFHMMTDGTVWIEIEDVFGGDARWLRRTADGDEWVPVEFPVDNIMRLLDASGDRVAAVLMDEFRVQSLAVFERVKR